eukprot:54518-Chlamydomonas_euryale.AAC.1
MDLSSLKPGWSDGFRGEALTLFGGGSPNQVFVGRLSPYSGEAHPNRARRSESGLRAVFAHLVRAQTAVRASCRRCRSLRAIKRDLRALLACSEVTLGMAGSGRVRSPCCKPKVDGQKGWTGGSLERRQVATNLSASSGEWARLAMGRAPLAPLCKCDSLKV